MRYRDPIIHTIGVLAQRVLLFVVLSLLVALGLWLWVLLGLIDIPAGDLMAWTPPEGRKLAAVLAYGCLAIGVLSITVLYLLVAKWWKKRGNVHHHRGARLDERED